MKAIRFLPLVYIVGVDGFVFFAPYILLLLSLAYAIRIARSQQLRPIVITVPLRDRLTAMWHSRPVEAKPPHRL